MPKLDYNDYQKKEEEPSKYTFSEVQTKDRQIYIKEEDILFDLVDLDFDGKGPGIEVLMSFVGEDFKMRCDVVPKDIFDGYDLPEYLISLIEEYKPCLECKKKFLEGLCSHGEEEEDPDEKA